MDANAPSKRILIADDDHMIIDMLKRLLEGAGYAAFTASCGQQAIAVATTNQIDLAILDYRMPDMTGLEAGKAIRDLTSSRFVIMSVTSDRRLVMQAADDGALGYLNKPLETDDVLNVVQIQLKRADDIRNYEGSIKKLEETRSLDVGRAVTSARLVNTAVGIIMEREKINRDDAYKQLRQRARREQRKLEELCAEILTRSESVYPLLSQDKGNTSRN